MPQTNFEKDIEEGKYENDLKRIRENYFPLINQEIITGYNLYPTDNMFNYSQGEIFLNYLHSDLRPRDKHYQELCKRLKEEDFSLEDRILINDELVDRETLIGRNADYLTRPGWSNPPNIRYFDTEGNEISAEKAKKSKRRMIIGESFQYDMLIRVKDEPELRKAIDLFKKYASQYKLNKRGEIIQMDGEDVENEDQIYRSWEIPLLLCTTKNDRKPKDLYDFLTVKQFNINEQLNKISIMLSTLVKSKREELEKILKRRGIEPQINKKYVLRVFVDYVEGKSQ